MKSLATLLIVLFSALTGAISQTFEFPCPDETNPQDIREVRAGFTTEIKQTPPTDILSVTFELCDQIVLLPEVRFKFRNLSSLFVSGIVGTVTINFGDGTSASVPPSGLVPSHFYPVNNTTLPVAFSVSLIVVPSSSTAFSHSSLPFSLILNPSNPVGGGNYVPPGTVHHVTVPKSMAPPIANAFPDPPNGQNIYNGNTIGGADAYIQYAPSHNGKLLKPLIFVDGVDFNEKVYTYNGQVVRHGSTGWDVFTMGNDNSTFNSLDDDNAIPTYRNYPAALSTLGNAENEYDIVYLDFERGSDWIQKNGEVLIELINWVNAEKRKNREAGLCTEDNAVVGASMGGQVAKWALSTMEQRVIPHETHTYVSFDSPQQGANIPLAIQSFALLANMAGLSPGSWNNLNSPAARQMVIHNLAGELEKGTVAIALSEISVNSCPGVSPIAVTPANLEFKHSVAIRDGFKAEMAALGYPGKCRNVGISMGSKDGTALPFGSGSTLLSGQLNLNVGSCKSLLDAQLFAINGAVPMSNPAVSFCASFSDWSTSFNLNCVNLPTPTATIFKGAVSDFVKDGLNFNLTNLFLTVTALAPFPNLDNAPGCKRGDLTGLGRDIMLSPFSLPTFMIPHVTASLALQQYTCFMPTISILDIQVPMNNVELVNPIDLDVYPTIGLTPFKAIFAPPANLRHIELDDAGEILNFSIEQMELGRSESIQQAQPMTINGPQTFNYGKERFIAPETTINSGGKMGVNLAGKTNFQNVNDPEADLPRFDVFIGYTCSTTNKITVKSGGVLQIGDPGASGNKQGFLHAVNDSKVIVENGGTLRISKNSHLILYENRTLELGDGANVILDDLDSKIVIHGILQVNGNINFSGTGCFQFEAGNSIVFGTKNNGQPNTQLKLVGQDKNNRFVRVQTHAKLDIPGAGPCTSKRGLPNWPGRFCSIMGQCQVYPNEIDRRFRQDHHPRHRPGQFLPFGQHRDRMCRLH